MLASIEQYLSALPNGVDSYPEALVKASVLQTLIDGEALSPRDDDLPKALRELIHHPVPAGSWVPEVLFSCAVAALVERRFSEPEGYEQYLRWVYEKAHALLDRPVYRVLFVALSPQRLITGAQHRWSTFHQESMISIVDRGDSFTRVQLSYPPHLFQDAALDAQGQAFRVAIEVAGAKATTVHRETVASNMAQFEITWQ